MDSSRSRRPHPHRRGEARRPHRLVDEETGEVIVECNEEITEAHLDDLKARNILEFPLLFLDPITTGQRFGDTLLTDKTLSQDEAIIEIYRRLRPGDPPTLDTATNLFNNLFFNAERYDLSKVGRLKLNHKMEFDGDEQVEFFPTGVQNAGEQIALGDLPTLRRDDILNAVKYLVDLKNGTDLTKKVDDIDHLGKIDVFASSANCSRTSTASVCSHGTCDQGAHESSRD